MNKGLVFSSRSYLGSVEPPATILEDESRYGNHGAFLADGEPNWVRNEKGLWVLDFDGNNDYVDLGDDVSLDITDKITLEAWVKVDATPTSEFIVGRDDGTNRNYFLWFDGGGKFGFIILTGGVLKNMDSVIVPTTGTYYHLVGVYNRTDLRTYVNGELKGTPAAATGVIDNDDVSLSIGAREAGLDRFLDGSVGKVRIHNGALSAEEIAARFQAHKHWFGV